MASPGKVRGDMRGAVSAIMLFSLQWDLHNSCGNSPDFDTCACRMCMRACSVS